MMPTSPAKGHVPIRVAPIEAPTLESVRPLPPDERPTLEPYRVLFPLGAACGIAGTLPWIAMALRMGAWPGMTHASLMVQGFELAFITGFLLTAMPAFTHGPKCRPWELRGTVIGVLAFATLRLGGFEAPAHLAYALTLAFAGIAVARRVRPGAAAPPEEFAMVGVGLLLGIAGGIVQALAAAGWLAEPSPRFGLHLVSRGMVLAIVLGLGGLLVPTFAMLPDPLRIMGVARAGQRGPRRAFLFAVATLIVGALAAEAAGRPVLGAWIRFGAGAASLLLAWKLWRFPPRAMRLPWALWAAGACAFIGLAAAALMPAHEIAAWHVVFVGSYGLLTMSIGTRVIVSHGGHDVRDETKVLSAAAIVLLVSALLERLLAGEVDPNFTRQLSNAAVAWVLAWTVWLIAAMPRILRTKRGLMMPMPTTRR